MKKYDFKKAKEIIESNKANLRTAFIGMAEDWWWTAEEVWNSEDNYTDSWETDIGGIPGSSWATPAILLQLEDGSERLIECFFGESSGERGGRAPQGSMSGPAQQQLPKLEKSI